MIWTLLMVLKVRVEISGYEPGPYGIGTIYPCIAVDVQKTRFIVSWVPRWRYSWNPFTFSIVDLKLLDLGKVMKA